MGRGTWIAALVCATSSIGFALSWWVSPPLGADHSCPAGSTPADCRYPADHLSWTVWWTLGGLVVGLGIGLAIRAIGNHRRDSASP